MDADKVSEAARGLPAAVEKRRRVSATGAVTVVVLVALPLLLVSFLLGDRAASVAADSLVRRHRSEEQSACFY
ncbi:hypothetical protein ABZP36_010872 [Zizania latifolia]